MKNADIKISLDPKLLSEFYAKDSSLGTLENPFKADSFCDVEATGIIKSGIHNVFSIQPNTSYNFKLISTNDSIETLDSATMRIKMIQNGVPKPDEWCNIFDVDKEQINEGILSVGNNEDEFTLKTVENIKCDNNLQYNINFTFKLNNETKYGVIDPLIANTSEG